MLFEARPVKVDTDTGVYTRTGWMIVIVGFGGFFLWASLAPLDRGVPLSGTVNVQTNKKAIQHPTGGTVDQILVKEGDVVKAGDELVRLNNIQAKANADTTRVQYYTARAAEARLLSERDGKSRINFPDELQTVENDSRVTSYISMQRQLFLARQSAIRNELASIDENISGLILQSQGLELARDSKKQQLGYIEEQLEGMRHLTQKGFIARHRLLDLEQTHAQTSAGIAEDTGNIGHIQRQISELRLVKMQRQQEYQKEVRTQLFDVQKEADSLASKLTSLDYDLANVVVKAPVDGTVVGIKVFTNGGVVAPGFEMMHIVPSNDSLVVEGQLPVHLVDKVRPGLPVEFIFSAFNQNTTPRVPGIVTSVSADRFVDEKSGQPYYKLYAEVAPQGMQLVRDLEIRPGMPVDMFVKTGERTMMNYLLRPIYDHLKLSMSEH